MVQVENISVSEIAESAHIQRRLSKANRGFGNYTGNLVVFSHTQGRQGEVFPEAGPNIDTVVSNSAASLESDGQAPSGKAIGNARAWSFTPLSWRSLSAVTVVVVLAIGTVVGSFLSSAKTDSPVLASTDSSENSSTIAGQDSAAVSALDSTVVSKQDNAAVSAQDGAVVSEQDSAAVSAQDGAVVSEQDSAAVSARDSVTIAGQDSATVTAQDTSTVTAKDTNASQPQGTEPLESKIEQSVAGTESTDDPSSVEIVEGDENELDTARLMAEKYLEEINALQSRNKSLQAKAVELDSETVELNKQLLGLELAMTAAELASKSVEETRVVYNIVNVPVGNSADQVGNTITLTAPTAPTAQYDERDVIYLDPEGQRTEGTSFGRAEDYYTDTDADEPIRWESGGEPVEFIDAYPAD